MTARANLDGDVDIDLAFAQQTTAQTTVKSNFNVSGQFIQVTGSDLFKNSSLNASAQFTTSITATNTTTTPAVFSSAFDMPAFDPTVYLFLESGATAEAAFSATTVANNAVRLSDQEGDTYTWDSLTGDYSDWPRNSWAYDGLHFPGDFAAVYNNNLILGTTISAGAEFDTTTIPTHILGTTVNPHSEFEVEAKGRSSINEYSKF